MRKNRSSIHYSIGTSCKTKVQFVGLGQTGSITNNTVLYCNVEKCQGELEIRLIHNAAAILSDVVRRHNEEEKEK